MGLVLHKWLCAPFGSGLFYVKRDKIKNLYPLFAGSDPEQDNIRKFENLGTRSFAIEQAIGHAIDFHNMIEAERKQKRLHYLKNYWMERAAKIPKVKLHTSLKPEFGCAIGMFSIEGKTPGEIATYLWKHGKVHAVGINWENIHGIRVTPNVYTLTYDLDRLLKYIERCAKE